MKCSVHAYAGYNLIFNGYMTFVPRIGETIDTEIGRFKVTDVIYKLTTGELTVTPVTIRLEQL